MREANKHTETYACSIVIRCFNEERHIEKLLSGIMAQTVNRVEIVLVDSGSTDATLTIASRYPVTILHIAPENFSFGHSLNIGCAHASADLIVIASAHIYPVYTDWLENLLKPFADPDVALVYGKQRGAQSSWYSEHQIYKKWFPDYSMANQGHPFCNNANAAIRKSLWQTYPYNRQLTGLEDLDWAKHFYDAGKKIVYCAGAEITHVHEERPRQIFNRYRREAIAFKCIYPDKRFSLFDFIVFYVANSFSDSCHARHDRMLLRELWGILLFRFMQFWGTYRGYQQRGFVSQELASRFYYPNGLSRIPENSREEKGTLIHYG